MTAGVEEVVRAAWADGNPVAGGDAARIAEVARRRWGSQPRRVQPTADRDRRIDDLATGLVAAFEADGRLVGPAKRDWRALARLLADALDGWSAGTLSPAMEDAWRDMRAPRAWTVEPAVEIAARLGADPEPYSVHVVPFVGDDLVVTRSEHGHWEMPGGRPEAGAGQVAAARRELVEEAGLTVEGPIEWFATVTARRGEQPWRTVAIGWRQASVIGPPTNPPGEVATIEVHVGPLADAVERLIRSDRSDLALGYETAVALRSRRR